MKTTFKNNKELCEAWIEQKQDFGKTNCLSFKGKLIMSYHYHPIARIDGNILLIRNASFNHVIKRHKELVEQAAQQKYKIYHVQNLELKHKTNIEYYVSQTRNLASQFWKNPTKEAKEKWKECIKEAKDYAQHYNCSPPDFLLWDLL